MGKIGLFYGSSSGKTRRVAEMISSQFAGEVEIRDIAGAKPEDLLAYDALILGASTEYEGDVQDDWDTFIFKHSPLDFGGRRVALFGLGDQKRYPDEFLDGLMALYRWVKDMNGQVVGDWPAKDFNFIKSQALRDGRLVGLGIDEDNQKNLTGARVAEWVRMLRTQLS
ncbi:MAG: flavodoxin [Myxococcales bacterium]|nr:flavodoxin [Myxococcales bacterium]